MADATESAMPFSASPRSAWMSVLKLFSVWVSTCALLSNRLRAAVESGLVTSDCMAPVKLLNAVSSELSELGAPYSPCSRS